MINNDTDTLNRDDQNDHDIAPAAPTELEVLKSRATLMKIPFSNNIRVETLRAKIEAVMNGDNDGNDDADDDAGNTQSFGSPKDNLDYVDTQTAPSQPVRPLSRKAQEQLTRETLMSEQMRLVRLRITNLDPKKKDLPGEIITMANDYLGTVRKFIPFGEVTDNGYHVPYCLYMLMKERRFLNIRTTKKAGQIQVTSGWAQEFALEELPPLTQDELNRLAATQAAAGGISDGMD